MKPEEIAQDEFSNILAANRVRNTALIKLLEKHAAIPEDLMQMLVESIANYRLCIAQLLKISRRLVK